MDPLIRDENEYDREWLSDGHEILRGIHFAGGIRANGCLEDAIINYLG